MPSCFLNTLPNVLFSVTNKSAVRLCTVLLSTCLSIDDHLVTQCDQPQEKQLHTLMAKLVWCHKKELLKDVKGLSSLLPSSLPNTPLGSTSSRPFSKTLPRAMQETPSTQFPLPASELFTASQMRAIIQFHT